RKVDSQLAVVNNTIIGNPKDSFNRRFDQPRNYYNSVPTAPFIQAFDPISVLASLAFLAFLLQSFAALFDRTRSLIPTIINSRQANYEYEERVADVEKIVLRALKDYVRNYFCWNE
ncbi:PREDICTED: uncharacterized protein LOC105365134, partial [Ceratosolen solmsi marchali]|uniref:Uncharacterized protein LOC105365134 n=1 Tax=Ceratosolen solmsi marchali TaxID=326594 RepID=A0AAJ6YNZ2_9HYME